MTGKTAILFFTNNPRTEAEYKFFLNGRDASNNAHIVSALIRYTLTVIHRSNLPFYTVENNQQRGNSFGERLANAFEDVFSCGHENVIAIGNDCPQLTASDLLHATTLVESGKSVLGPAGDGGAYLIGFNRQYFTKETFSGLLWKKAGTIASLTDYFEQHKSEWIFLQKHDDLDTSSDLLHYHLPNQPELCCLKYFQLILRTAVVAGKRFRLTIFSLLPLNKFELRGPPAVAN